MMAETPSVIRVITLGRMNMRRQLRNQGNVWFRPIWEIRRRAAVRLFIDNRVCRAGRNPRVIPATTR